MVLTARAVNGISEWTLKGLGWAGVAVGTGPSAIT